VDLTDVGPDAPGAHAAGVERDDLIVETREAAAVLVDQGRVETAMAIAWNGRLERAYSKVPASVMITIHPARLCDQPARQAERNG